jgi:predicted metalloprotease
MRLVPGRALAAAVTGLLLAGCASTVVTGTARPGADAPVDVAADQFPITGASDSAIDQLTRNALADLDTFWTEAYPEYFGEAFRPLENGYFSVDSDAVDESAYPATGIGCEGSPTSPDSVAGNAFYDPGCDLIAYDRNLLEELASDYGRFLAPVVMAHEFAHAMQGRFGFAASGRGIQDETQADCLAGAWASWVAAGEAEHVSLRTPELDDVVRGFLLLRDDVGSDPEDTEAHGSYFDRVSAFYEGFDGGVAPCRDDFGTDRIFTAAAFSETDYLNKGNARYEDIIGWIGQTLPLFWASVFPDAFGTQFEPPALQGFHGAAPDCRSFGKKDPTLGYCAEDETVYYDEAELTGPAYDELGDFAVATALALPYALAARDQAGLSAGDGTATRSAVCLTGWYTAQWYDDEFADSLEVTLSPGDVDEAVRFLLDFGADPRVFPDVTASGFELVGAFRTGFLAGGTACDLTS